MSNPYDTLGVDKDADASTIKKAFRKKARQHHPDVNKGDPSAEEKFKEINHAYRILNNPLLKERWDQYGDAGAEKSNEAEAVKVLVNLIMATIDRLDDYSIKQINVVESVRKQIEQNDFNMRENIKNLQKQIKRWKEAGARLRSKGKGNFMEAAFTAHIGQIESEIKTQEFQMEIGKEMLSLLDDYEYRTDKNNRPLGFTNTMQFIIDDPLSGVTFR